MARKGLASGTATVLFTDLVGSTDLMARVGDATFDRMRTAHRAETGGWRPSPASPGSLLLDAL